MSDFFDFIVCPYCGDIDHETSEYPSDLERDGDSIRMECGACGEVMRVELCATYTYRATTTHTPARHARGSE